MNSFLDRPGFKLPYMGMRRPNASHDSERYIRYQWQRANEKPVWPLMTSQ